MAKRRGTEQQQQRREMATYQRPAEDMRSLRRCLKFARTGNGEVAKHIETSNFVISERGFTLLIAACRRTGQWRKAMEIFDAMTCARMVSIGLRPNFYNYSSLISVCCNAGRPAKALKVFRRMVTEARKSPDLQPDQELYRTLIAACFDARRYADVAEVYDVMTDANLTGDYATLRRVLRAFTELGEYRAAFNALNALHAAFGALNGTAYTKLISTFASGAGLGAAVELFLTMQMVGVEPVDAHCHELLAAAVGEGDRAAVAELLREMSDGGILLLPETRALLAEQKGRE